MANTTMTVRVRDTDQFIAMHRILSTLFATEVSDVRACRKCGCPVVHMAHLTLDEARAIETEVRTLLNIPATLPDEV